MSTFDPFINSADAIGEPYKNAYAINKADLITGDVELPFVSSALYFSDTVRYLKVQFLGGAVVTLPRVGHDTLLPIRVTKILHQEFYAGADPYDNILPRGIIALW